MIDIDGAERYFAAGNHVESAAWAAFPLTARQGAIACARRQLERALGRALRDAEPAYAPGDTSRDEYAAYEQALFLLTKSRVYDAGSGAPYPTALNAVEGAQAPEAPPGVGGLAVAALQWLGWTGAATVRG